MSLSWPENNIIGNFNGVAELFLNIRLTTSINIKVLYRESCKKMFLKEKETKFCFLYLADCSIFNLVFPSLSLFVKTDWNNQFPYNVTIVSINNYIYPIIGGNRC